MTVGAMLRNMSQKELCHWIAYFRIENEQYADKNKEQEAAQIDKPKISVKQVGEVTQEQKDGAMLSQLFALAARNDLE